MLLLLLLLLWPRIGWMVGVKRALNEREMSVEQERMIVSDRSE